MAVVGANELIDRVKINGSEPGRPSVIEPWNGRDQLGQDAFGSYGPEEWNDADGRIVSPMPWKLMDRFAGGRAEQAAGLGIAKSSLAPAAVSLANGDHEIRSLISDFGLKRADRLFDSQSSPDIGGDIEQPEQLSRCRVEISSQRRHQFGMVVRNFTHRSAPLPDFLWRAGRVQDVGAWKHRRTRVGDAFVDRVAGLRTSGARWRYLRLVRRVLGVGENSGRLGRVAWRSGL